MRVYHTTFIKKMEPFAKQAPVQLLGENVALRPACLRGIRHGEAKEKDPLWYTIRGLVYCWQPS